VPSINIGSKDPPTCWYDKRQYQSLVRVTILRIYLSHTILKLISVPLYEDQAPIRKELEKVPNTEIRLVCSKADTRPTLVFSYVGSVVLVTLPLVD
jgi:hypothetical protein